MVRLCVLPVGTTVFPYEWRSVRLRRRLVRVRYVLAHERGRPIRRLFHRF